MNIEIPYTPRPGQAQLHGELQARRWGVVVCHRRWGKTVMAINHLLRDAVLNSRPNPRFAYIAPTYRQAKAVAWDYLKQIAGSVPMVRFHETELRQICLMGPGYSCWVLRTLTACVASIWTVPCWTKWQTCLRASFQRSSGRR